MKRANLIGSQLAALAFVSAAVIGAAGCGGESADVPGIPEIESVSSAFTTTFAGPQYAANCFNNNVPLPPPWWTGTVGTQWKENLDPSDPLMRPTFPLSESFVGTGGHVYFYQPTQAPTGMCVLLEHENANFDVICQGTNGKACFWEKTGGPTGPPPSTPFYIASLFDTIPGIPGGTDLGNPDVTDRCTSCHAGENAFIGHFAARHPLNLVGKAGWMPPFVYSNPYVPAGYPQAPPSTVNYPASCMASCHTQGGLAGRFPLLETSKFDDHYCKILRKVVSIPPEQGGMPPTSSCFFEGDTGCPVHSDPAVRAMLAACAAPNPPVPPSIAGIAPPGIGFRAGRRHISASKSQIHEHSFTDATTTFPNAGCCAGQTTHGSLMPSDKIEVSVYLPADDKPREIMLKLFAPSVGAWRRVFFGEDLIQESPRTAKGGLPVAGSWTVLSFTPADLGFTGPVVFNGMAFTLFGGSASWADVLFRNSDLPMNNQFVSQVWVGDHLPGGAVEHGSGGDGWRWAPDDMAALFPTLNAFSSSTMGDGVRDGAPGHGNDGNTDGDWFHGSVFHTGQTIDSTSFGLGPGGEWWYVDLGFERTIRRVVLYNRTDCCLDRLSHFRINVFDPFQSHWVMVSDQSNTITSSANPVIAIDINAVNAQFVMVQKTDHNFLHLAAVEVYGDP